MNYSRIVGVWFVAIIVLAFAAGLGATLADTEDVAGTVELRWALGAWEMNGEKPSAVTADRQLDTGTKLKFLVEPLSPGSVYLILLDSADEIHVLYRESTTEVAGRAYVPPGQHRFELDNHAGRETLSCRPGDVLPGCFRGAAGRVGSTARPLREGRGG